MMTVFLRIAEFQLRVPGWVSLTEQLADFSFTIFQYIRCFTLPD
jgi:hypothetical protein